MPAKITHRSPPPGYTDLEVLTLTRDGIWRADGEEITHEPTRRLFSRSLKRDAGGWFIHIGQETKYIQVEDTAFFVRAIHGAPESGFDLELSDETRERLDSKTLHYDSGRLTCRLRYRDDAGERPEAKFLAAPYHDFLRHLEEDEKGYFIMIEGCRVQLS